MSNLPLPGIVDATGVLDNVALAGNSQLLRTVGGDKRLVVHDGVTPGGIPHVTQFPNNAYSPLLNGYLSAIHQHDAYWWDATNNHLRFATAHDLYYGCRNDAAPIFTPWMATAGFQVYYDAWRLAVDQSDAVTAAWALARCKAQWVYTKTRFGAQALRTGDNSSGGEWVAYTIDDGVYQLGLYHMVADVYGPTTTEGQLVIGYAQELLPNLLAYFRDTRSTNPTVDYGVSSPLGVAFKRNMYGVRYPHPGDQGSLNFYQDCSSSIEHGLAREALWLSKQAGVSAAYATALVTYAKDTWTFGLLLRTPDPSTLGDPTLYAPAGAQYASLIIDPNVNANNNSSINGGAASNTAYGYQANQRFLQPYNGVVGFAYGNPKRAAVSQWEAATQYRAVLSAELAALPSADPKYAAEALAIANVYADPLCFGRLIEGLPRLGSFQDPHSIGRFMVQFMRSLAAVPGFNRNSTLVKACINTARHLLRTRVRGLIGPNWHGEEKSVAGDGRLTFIWEDEGAFDGTQAYREQIMVSSGGVNCAQAALLFRDVETTMGSGTTAPVSIEQLAEQVASLGQVQRESMTRSGGSFFGPITVRTRFFGLGHYQAVTSDGVTPADVFGLQPTLQFNQLTWIRANEAVANLEFVIGGQKVGYFGGGNYGFAALGALFPNGSTTSNLSYNGQTISVNAQNNCAIAIDQTNQVASTYIGGAQKFYVNSLGASLGGAFSTAGVIIPTVDNSWALGGSGNRWTTGYFVNSIQVTSDLRDKKLRTENDGAPTDAELDWALEVAGLPRLFQWLTKVATEGAGARFHASPIVQDVIRAGQRHGCISGSVTDPLPTSFAYGFIGWDANPPKEQQDFGTAETGEDGVLVTTPGDTVTITDRDRYMIRPDGLMWLCLAAFAREKIRVDARLAALEAK